MSRWATGDHLHAGLGSVGVSNRFDQNRPTLATISSKIVKGSTLNIYPGAPHGLCSTRKDQINADLLAFLKA